MKKVELFSKNNSLSIPRPPNLGTTYGNEKIKAPPQLKPEKSAIRETPEFNEASSPVTPIQKFSKFANLKSLQSRGSVTSITFEDNNHNIDYSEMESPTRRGFEVGSTRPLNSNYLSLMSMTDEFNLRPSQTSIKRFRFEGLKNSLNNNESDKCEECQYEGEMENLYKLGWVAWSWIVFLFLSTIILFFLPIVMKSYQKKELICPECGSKVRTENPPCL